MDGENLNPLFLLLDDVQVVDLLILGEIAPKKINELAQTLSLLLLHLRQAMKEGIMLGIDLVGGVCNQTEIISTLIPKHGHQGAQACMSTCPFQVLIKIPNRIQAGLVFCCDCSRGFKQCCTVENLCHRIIAEIAER
ncbi:hypothetical protein SDC9_181905 [bioreactor metagenome]|uniref:Uncharacterized protein n=1 Tax=bioreactor metagenome TaxID=1076179 RepID=A0A645H7R7_9ZZZZ